MTEEQEQVAKKILEKYLGPELNALAANVPEGLALKDSLLKHMAAEVIEQVAFHQFLENIQVVEEIDNESEETTTGIGATGPNANSVLNLSTTNTRKEPCIGSIPGSSLQKDEARTDLIHSLSVLLVHLKERTESRCDLDAAAQKCEMFTKAMFPTDVKAAMGEEKFEPEELTRSRFVNVSNCTTSGENKQ